MNKPTQTAKLFSWRCFVMDFMRVTGALPTLLWLRPHIRYTSRQAKQRVRGGALVIANHTGFIDPVYTMMTIWYRRQYFVVHRVFADTKAGALLRAAGCLIPIEADNFRLDSFRAIINCLTEGKAVTIFPEGHINGGKMMEFQSGAALMAMQSGCPIVPLYIQPRRHWYSRLRTVVDEPINVDRLCEGMPAFAKIDAVTRYLQERMAYLESLFSSSQTNDITKQGEN